MREVVLTLGTFDGVHRGHQALIRKAGLRAKALGVDVLAAAFLRPPRLHFSPSDAPSLLTTPSEKKDLLRRFGARRAVLLAFNRRLAALSAKEFFDHFIRRRWRAREIVVGYDFGFGRHREGSPALLRALGASSGVRVHVVPALKTGGRVISSGAIRRALAAGDVGAASRMSGYAPFVTARVIRGRGLGRTLGTPTANLDVPPEKILPPGVFAVKVSLPGGAVKRGVCNVGHRPTLGGGLRRAAEVHLFDFTASLYGKTITVEFLHRLRPERKFPSLQALSTQIARDLSRACAWFQTHPLE